MRLLGIDFGTCYIKCFDVEKEELKALDTLVGGESSYRLANVITYKAEGDCIVGEPNFFQKKLDDVVISNIKSNLVQEKWNVELANGKIKNAYDVVKDIMQYLFNKLINDSPDENEYCAVITTPVNFSKRQNEIIRKAASAAGFSIREVVSEPFASLFYLMQDNMDNKHNVLVIDIGGGTLDLCLVKINVSDTISVITESTNGINYGGNTIDEEIVEYLMSREKELHDVLTKNEPRENAYNKLKLLYEIKQWKQAIFDEDYDEDADKDIFFDPFKGELMELNLTVQEVIHILDKSGIKEKITVLLDDLFENSESLICKDVTDVFVTGGTSMIPYFEDCVKEYFENELLSNDDNKIEKLFELNSKLDIEEKTVASVAQGAGLYNLCCTTQNIKTINSIPTKIFAKSKDGEMIAQCNLEQTKYEVYTPESEMLSKVSLDEDNISVYQSITVDIEEDDDKEEEIYIGRIPVDDEIKNQCEHFRLQSDLNGCIYAEFGNYEGRKEECKFVPKYCSELLYDI